jgi:hypothetical protein
VNPQIEMTHATNRCMKLSNDPPHPVHPGQQGLSPMKDDLDAPEAMQGRVLGDTARSPRSHVIRYDQGPAAPAPVGSFIYVAVVTGKIAAAMYFNDKLLQRN